MSDTLVERFPKPERKKRPPKIEIKNYSMEAARVGRTTSLMWDAENDPFQVFEVEHESCFDLEVVVKSGQKITKGYYRDLIDVPDPYVILKIPGSSNSSKRTSHVDNNINPIWNETFHFFLDPKKKHTLNITLMDANHFQDEFLGVQYIDIESLKEDVPSDFILEYEGGSKVFLTMKLQKNKQSDLRFSLSLCEEEKEFLRQRRLNVMQRMQEMLGDRGPKNKNEVPVIAVLGSGGGFRAMTCFSAAVEALHQTGILGCSTYISGLSGSSWFISTLYAKDNFPNVTHEEIYEDFKKSVTQNWKWNLMHSYRYVLNMMDKSRKGQPVSFTDIFGHLLGDVLLKENKAKKLSDQRQIVLGGKVPLPLYTCLHAKASVSCRAFSEWIEFSPFEIGIAKYGTFMKPEYFGSKFLVGKLIKQFPEFPLHYLQGVWGSAFTILMKRLAFDGGSKQDLVQMMRDVNEERAINERLENEYLEAPEENQSSTDDDVDVEGADDKSSDDDENKGCRTLEEDIAAINELLGTKNPYCQSKQNSFDSPTIKEEAEPPENARPSLENNTLPAAKDNSTDKKVTKGFSFNFMKKGSFDLPRNESQDEANNRKISTQSDPGIMSTQTNMDKRRERLTRKGAVKETRNSSYWTNKRKARKSQKERKPTIIQNWMKTSGLLNSRAGRAGEILNPFRGLSLRNSFPLSPFSMAPDDEDEDDDDLSNELRIGLGCRYKPLDNNAKKLFIVDSGLAFNSPFPLLLRPQRAVDMYLSFDFSQRPSDSHMPFKELLLAEEWAKQNKVSFPPIEKLAREFSKDKEVKELYVFKDENDPYCPVILHFTIVNNRFKWFKAPGVRRETEEEIDFANFTLFNDPSQPFASTNFVYEPLQYERLFKLIEFNTLSNIERIKEEIAEFVEKKRKIASRPTENMLRKMHNVMNACKKFHRSGNMSLKVNESHRKRFIAVCEAAKISASSLSSNEASPPYFDAADSFNSFDYKEEPINEKTENIDNKDNQDIFLNENDEIENNEDDKSDQNIFLNKGITTYKIVQDISATI